MKGIILSGFRPTGRVHIGNLIGALENWVKLQNDYTCFFEIADWHLLTTKYDTTSEIPEAIFEMTVDWIAAGIDPEHSVIFVQSEIKEHAELNLILSMITPMSWLERNPTLKEQVRNLELNNNINLGLFGYPVLQAADIMMYKATAVPVGEDQLPHLELCREIARRFNSLYSETFPEPKSLITNFPRVPGTDGRKMSKSMNNAIYVADSREEIEKKVKTSITDTAKVYKNDPGHPDVCPVFTYHTIFNSSEVPAVRSRCEKGELGCVDCKKNAAAAIDRYISPIREKRESLLKDPSYVKEILRKGAVKAREAAVSTMDEVNKKMNLK